MKTCILLALLIAQAVVAGESHVPARPKVVFIKDWQVFSVYADGTGLKQLTTDGGRKHHPVWSPDGSRIAYLVKPEDALSQLTVITDSGDRVTEITIRPETDTLWGGMRFVEDLSWLNGSQVVLEGSINPANGEYVVLDLKTGKEIEWHFGSGSFVRSPDGSRVACWGLEGIGRPEAEIRNVLEINSKIVYPGNLKTNTLQFLSKPAWSADSQQVALIERDVNTRAVSLTVLSAKPDLAPAPGVPLPDVPIIQPAAVLLRQPLDPDIDNSAEIQWIGHSFVVSKGGAVLYEADPVRRIGQPAAADTVQTVREVTARRLQAAQLKRSADALMRKLGGNGYFDVWTGPPEQLQSDHEQ